MVRAFDGDAWTTVGTLSALVPAKTYAPVTIEANADSATLTVNGQRFTTTVRAGTATSFDGLTFTTGDPSEYGGIYYLDDVTTAG